MIHLAVFASGTGSNARALIRYFRHHPQIAVRAVFCNRPQAGVVQVAAEEGVPLVLFSRYELYDSDHVLNELRRLHMDYIALAGFLWKIPERILQAYPGRIVNLHPALLPKYGGKGMYGMKVHQEVLQAGERESGITIHLVNERYDAGPILFQQSIPVQDGESAEQLAQRIHELEHFWYPRIIEQWILDPARWPKAGAQP
ncbi:MAG: phosphoribosylglycinamide formyltransferase [Chitinophagales bacterium]|nr:phosphoribosylglycinamide formyltransferase [Chitinophagales bacterium]MDW8393088.1 phosphoribosylglycinamide formyltransferase [Chitinophagales bacterium]